MGYQNNYDSPCSYHDTLIFSQMNFPLCTIAHTPRLPEHCIEWVRMLLWSKESPFNAAPIDGDDPAHINWILEKAQERASQFNITGVTYRLTQVQRAVQIKSSFYFILKSWGTVV